MADKTTYVWTETNLVHPETGNKLLENSKTYFDNETGLSIWKTVAWHELTEDEVSEMLWGNVIGPFELNKKAGGTFKASLKFDKDENKVSFVFENNWGGWFQPGKESKFKCPISGNPLTETDKAYSNKDSWFTLWKVMSQHAFTEDEVSTLLKTWEVGPITDFVSTKSWKSFSAKVILDENENKKPTFKFEER
jgi:hypothetical protein